jgi:phosphopantothenate synthetase
MAVNMRAFVELENLGVHNVRLMMMDRAISGSDRGASVKLGLQGFDPSRGEVEEWLVDKERKSDADNAARHASAMKIAARAAAWSRFAAFAAIIAAVAATASFVASSH